MGTQKKTFRMKSWDDDFSKIPTTNDVDILKILTQFNRGSYNKSIRDKFVNIVGSLNLMSRHEAANLLGVHPTTLRRIAKLDGVEEIRTNSGICYRRIDIKQLALRRTPPKDYISGKDALQLLGFKSKSSGWLVRYLSPQKFHSGRTAKLYFRLSDVEKLKLANEHREMKRARNVIQKGKKFGYLTVLTTVRVGTDMVKVRCDCGRNVSIIASQLLYKQRVTCGCGLYKAKLSESNLSMVRNCLKNGDRQNHIAKKFGISVSLVSQIANGYKRKVER